MKSIQKFFNYSLFIFAFCVSLNIYSQLSLNPDSVKTGVSYKFVLYNDVEVIGKVTSSDSLYINVLADNGSYRLKKEDVFFISRDLVHNKFRVMLSLGGGVSFLNHGNGDYAYYDYYGYSNNYEFKPKYSFQLSGLFPLGENKGIRADFGYSKWKKDAFTYYYNSGYEDYTSYTEQTKEMYYFKGDFVFGLISPVNKFWIYGDAGFGIHFVKDGPYTDTHKYYQNWDSTYHTSTYNSPGQNNTSAVLSIGSALGYRFSKQLGIYVDAQLEIVPYEGSFFFFWGSGQTYIPVRAGITYTIF